MKFWEAVAIWVVVFALAFSAWALIGWFHSDVTCYEPCRALGYGGGATVIRLDYQGECYCSQKISLDEAEAKSDD